MAYTDRDEVRLILNGVVGDLPASATSLSDEQIDAEIARVESEIDVMLRGMYEVPFSPVPLVIKYIARDMSIYYCDLTFRMSNSFATSLDPIVLRYRNAKSVLNSIAAGEYVLDAERDNHALGGSVINPYDGELISAWHLFGPAIYG